MAQTHTKHDASTQQTRHKHTKNITQPHTKHDMSTHQTQHEHTSNLTQTHTKQPLQCTGCSACGALTNWEGTFSDGSAEYDYNNDALCKWLIAPGGSGPKTVTIEFDDLDLEEGYDFVYIGICDDASCATGNLVGSATGSEYPYPSFTVTARYILVEFASDGSVVGRGFSARYISSWD
jgi:hypothetical protein